jgi:hypothetical protein
VIRAAVSLALLVLAAGCALAPERGQPTLALSEAQAARQILLTVRQDRTAALQLLGAPSTRYANRRGYGPSPSVERILNQLARVHGLTRVDGWPIASLDVYCGVFAVSEGSDVDALIEALADDPRVELVQRMNTFETLVSRYDDTYADLQDSVLQLEIEPAHRLATGKGVTVAVIDSRIDERHPDLRGHVATNRDLVGGRSKSGEIHGTAVAGIIASTANNTEGIVGIAPDVAIAALRACWAIDIGASTARCSTFSLAQALEVAIALQAQIINLSLAGPRDPLLSQLLDQALQLGIIVVAAAPEDADDPRDFPASHAGVIAAQAGTRPIAARRPNTVPAPGDEIITTIPNAAYGFFSGNSLAAAHVSGVIALLLEREPGIDPESLALVLAESSTRRGAGATSISACRALARLIGPALCTSFVGAASLPRSF